MTWQGTGTDVDQSYNVYQLETEKECWVLIGTKPVEGENQGVYTFDTVKSGQPDANFYAVTTIDIYDNESDLSIAGGPEPTS